MNPFLFRLFRYNEIRVHELNYLFWECTTRCNLHCRHCGSDCTTVSGNPDMPLEDFLRALETVPVRERVPGFTVVLTGGEPLLRPDIDNVVRSIRERGVGVGMVSNGYFYDEKKHERMIEAGLGALTISLDGLEESHDWMRGRSGSYTRALKGIELAAHSRLAFDVVTCVNQRNFHELPRIWEVLQGVGVPQWRLFTIIPIGRAASDQEMHLSNEQFLGLMEFIKERRAVPSPMKTTFSCEGYLGPYEEVVRDTPYFCHAGVNIASVLIDGRINACPNIDRDAFTEGSIYKDRLWEVWNSGFKRYRNRNWAKVGSCRGCPVWKNCLGGGMHNWHGSCEAVLNCHYGKIRDASAPELP